MTMALRMAPDYGKGKRAMTGPAKNSAMKHGLGAAAALALGATCVVPATAQDEQADFARAVALLDQEDDEQGAYALFSQLCATGHARACFRAGDLLGLISETEEEDETACALVMKSCELGFGPGCRDAGDQLSFEDGSDPEALALFARGCELSDAISCRQAGFMHQIGRGVETRSFPVARGFYERACILSDPAGCHAAGVTVISEQGRRGYELARSYFRRGLAIDPEHPDSKLALEQIASF